MRLFWCSNSDFVLVFVLVFLITFFVPEAFLKIDTVTRETIRQ